MTAPVSSYSFLPWLRQGIAGKVTSADLDPAVKLRATVPLALELAGDGGPGGLATAAVPMTVQLYGPGDVVGIESRAIVRVDPRNWITNFKPNYLPSIEFYDEDFPWRYTPATPDGNRLRPWIALVVLKEDEFAEGTNIQDKPLPYVTVKPADRGAFPKSAQLAAWAHVHVNRSLSASDGEIVSTAMSSVLSRLQATLSENPDLAYSRILSPRRLEANVAYHAFLMPVFESGRLAGLGLDPAKTPFATQGAWDDYPAGPGTREEPESYPFYHRWYFRTGAIGDFEYLVRMLQPRPVDKRVGTRDLDVRSPDPNVPGITKAGLGGVLQLGGALRVPLASLSPQDRAEVEKYETWATPYPQPFQTGLSTFINLADDYAVQSASQANAAAAAAAPQASNSPPRPVDPDPLITPPLYGRWHALASRLLKDRNGAAVPDRTNWVHELNLDPRYRAAAGLGTRVIQQGQEDYMSLAWAQIGAVLDAIRRIRAAQVAREVSSVWYERHLKTLQAANLEKGLLITAPVQSRVVSNGLSVQYQVSQSLVSSAATSTAMRRVTRPGSRLVERLGLPGTAQPRDLLTRINAGEVAAAPPKAVPSGLNTVEGSSRVLLPAGVPGFVINAVRRWRWLPMALLALGLLIALLLLLLLAPPLSLWLAGLLLGLLTYCYLRLNVWRAQIQRADRLTPAGQRPDAVDQLPPSPGFVVSAPGAASTPSTGTADSAEATRFKAGLTSAYTLLEMSTQVSVPPPKLVLDLPDLAAATLAALDPGKTIPARARQGIVIPEHIATLQVEEFQEPLYYPEFDLPMYQALYNLSAELFVPNVNLIPENSITLLESNQRFIESYMVGLNYEFGRELLWREYPSDNRGSYFRQFWDVSGYFNTGNEGDAELREKLKDIPPLHLWSKRSALGSHDNRDDRGAARNEAVLVIRGELLKRYPTAVIYAHRAVWSVDADGKMDASQPRELASLPPAEQASPPRTKMRMPLYSAKVEPDIYFLGFDLTVDEAIGGTGENATDDPGWFIVMKERPGEPRFGLDISREGALNVWNDLAWPDVLTGAAAGACIELSSATATIPLVEPLAAAANHAQWTEDSAVSWSKDASSADLAYIMFQAPVLVAIHAAELLRRP